MSLNRLQFVDVPTNRSLEVGETPWLLRTAIRQQTTGQRQELRDLPQASSSRRHPPSQNPLDKELCGVKSNNSSVYSWRPEFAWSATTQKQLIEGLWWSTEIPQRLPWLMRPNKISDFLPSGEATEKLGLIIKSHFPCVLDTSEWQKIWDRSY